jgi:hypothetical protein
MWDPLWHPLAALSGVPTLETPEIYGNLVEKCGKRVFLSDETGKPAEQSRCCQAAVAGLQLPISSQSVPRRGFSNLQFSDLISRGKLNMHVQCFRNCQANVTHKLRKLHPNGKYKFI